MRIIKRNTEIERICKNCDTALAIDRLDISVHPGHSARYHFTCIVCEAINFINIDFLPKKWFDELKSRKS